MPTVPPRGADHHLLVVQGTMNHWDLDETAADGKRLGPGSSWYQPGGRAHRDGYAVAAPRP